MPIKSEKIPGSPEEGTKRKEAIINFENKQFTEKSNKLELDKDTGLMNKNISLYNPKLLDTMLEKKYSFKRSELAKSKQQELIDLDEYLNFEGNVNTAINKNPVSVSGKPLNPYFLDLFANYRIRKRGEKTKSGSDKMVFGNAIDKKNHSILPQEKNGRKFSSNFGGIAEILYKVKYNNTDYLIIKPRYGGNDMVDVATGRNLRSDHYSVLKKDLIKWNEPIAIPEYVYNAAKVVFGNKSNLFFRINANATKTPSLYFSAHMKNRGNKRINEMKNYIFPEAYYNYRPDTKMLKQAMPEVFKMQNIIKKIINTIKTNIQKAEELKIIHKIFLNHQKILQEEVYQTNLL